MRARTFIVVAARNEAQRIGATLAALADAFAGAPVWVADDGSRDATAAIARGAGATVISQPRPRGKGAAMSAAAAAALAQARAEDRAARAEDRDRARAETPRAGGYAAVPAPAVFVLCDGDLAGSARELRALADAVARGEASLAVGAFRVRAGGGVGLALGFARWAVRRACGVRMRAPLSGQRALSEGALAAALPFARGYGMEVAMTIDAARAGQRVAELELELSHRASGRTPAGFAHRARQLADCVRAYASRR